MAETNTDLLFFTTIQLITLLRYVSIITEFILCVIVVLAKRFLQHTENHLATYCVSPTAFSLPFKF